MNPADTGKAYDQITHLWADDVFNRQNGIPQHELAISLTTNRGKALDVGCGCTGRFFDLLLSAGFTPEGVDVSEKMLSLAKLKYPALRFYHADICEWEVPKQYDFITAWDSIWHVPLYQQESVVTKLVNSLAPGGILIFSFGGTEDADEHNNSVMGPTVYYSTLGTHGYLKLIEKLGCECKRLEFDQAGQLHAWMSVKKPV